MDKMIRIIKFDLAINKKIIIFLMIWFFVFGQYFAISVGDLTQLPISIMLWATVIAGLPFIIRDRFGIENLLITFPINRRNIIRGRYVYAVINGFLCLAMSEIMICTASGFFNIGFDMKMVSASLCVGFLTYSLIISIQLPMYFRYSFAQVIDLASIFLYIIFIICYQLSYYRGNLYGNIEDVVSILWKIPLLMVTATLVLAAVMLYGSYLLSYKVYNKKNL